MSEPRFEMAEIEAELAVDAELQALARQHGSDTSKQRREITPEQRETLRPRLLDGE